MGYDPGGVEQVRCLVLFDPFEVGIDFPICTVGSTHGYSHSGPFGAGLSKLHTLVQQQWGRGEGECSYRFSRSDFEYSRVEDEVIPVADFLAAIAVTLLAVP